MNKLQKITHRIQVLLNHNKTFKRAFAYNNHTLTTILNAVLHVKKNDIAIEDKLKIDQCESFRSTLLESSQVITYEVFKSDHTNIVSDICKKATSPPVWCRFLYFLTKNLKAKNILEIGTNLGVSGTIILEAQSHLDESMFTTMEGLPQLCNIAGNEFEKHSSKSCFKIVEGLYENTFDKVIADQSNYDLMFIDGNHQKDPTIEYFLKLKSKSVRPCVMIFDDIYWSQGMREAWDFIINDKDINFSLNLYKQGIVILDSNEKTKNVNFNIFVAR